MATKNELAISKKWSQLTKKEKSRFKNKQSFSRRRKNQLSSQNSVFNIPTTTNSPIVGPQPPSAPSDYFVNVPTTTNSPIFGPEKTPQSTPQPTPAPSDYFVNVPTTTNSPIFGPEKTPQSTPQPTPETTTEPEPFDYAALVASLTESIGTPFQGQIDTLTDDLGRANTTIDDYEETIGYLQSTIKDDRDEYNNRISGLQDTLNDYSGLMTGYQSQITGLRDDLREAQKQANQLKIRDTRYIADNSAGGVRLKRSNKFNSGAFAMGTGQLNRNFKSPLSISNVNL